MSPLRDRAGRPTGPAGSKLRRIWLDWRGFLLFVAVMLVFRSAIADWNQVPSGSMEPTILTGDRIVVDKLAYSLRVPFTLERLADWNDPQRGDIITFLNPIDDRQFIKRVVGIPGDTVELRRNQLIINGVSATYEPLTEEEYARLRIQPPSAYKVLRETILGQSRTIMVLRYSSDTTSSSFRRFDVPPDNYLVLGDNRDNSGDFRKIGPVSQERILGRAHSVAFSLDSDNYYAPRIRRFFVDLS